ncbi:DUF4097 family beta strand repeat-containing protein [Bacillus piscicola]|uniref:DUF4097 family beta strand repeat-containing protein n=1 Tax=Bacillus piscicola TaxID=1632684 RepID=UPI001F08A270|nr:DUF4097 domain-containing protein [Bacillus piscicola]
MEEERKIILKMVEDGKISAEDGAKLLKALKPEEDAEEKRSHSRRNNLQRDEAAKETASKDASPTISGPSTGSSLSTKVDWEEGNKRFNEWDRDKQRKWDFTTAFTEFIDNTIQKIKDLDLDFNFGSYQDVHHIFQHKNMKELVLDISLENGSAELRPWDEEDVKISCDVKVYNGKTIDEARRQFLKETIFEVADNELHFYTKTKTMKVNAVIYVPRKTYESIQLYTFNGHLRVEDVTAERFLGKVVNGSLAISSALFKKCEGETVNGPITLRSGNLGVVDVKTMNGTIEIEAQIRDLEAESVNGTIDSTLDIAEDARADFSTATGSIFVKVPASIRTDGYLKTNVGNYHYPLSDIDIIEEKKDFIHKALRFTSNQSASPRLRLEADTKTGSISIKPKQ